ncbi:MAG: hypothetical protein ACE5IY_03595 [bacterium]
MNYHLVEKRKHPRLDTSANDNWKIKVFGLKGRPLEGQILNLSLGGVAFRGHWRNVAKAVKRFTTKVEIQTPDGYKVNANTNLVRVWPSPENDQCVCVLELTEMNKTNTSRLLHFIPYN